MRSKGIGGTDIGAIVGVNPWMGPMDVYLEKVGVTESEPDNEAMYWGREMEPVLEKRYMKETGYVKIVRPGVITYPAFDISHPDLDWMLGSPDGIIYDANDKLMGGVDYKTTGRRNDYGAPGTDEVPEWVHTQADWYMGLTGAEWWDIAVLFFAPRREFAIYRIPRNQELIDNLIEAAKDFWENHVLPKVPPPLDASEGSKKLLNYLYPRDTQDLFAATPEIEQLAREIHAWESARDYGVKNLTLAQNQMKDIIGDNAGVVTSLGKITWRKNRDTEAVDWKAAYQEVEAYIPPNVSHDAIDKYTTIRPGSRVFRAWWKKEKD